MRYRTRAFLLCFVPVAILLTIAFAAAQNLVERSVVDGFRASLRETGRSIARIRARGDLQNSRFLSIAGENASLKAGLQLLRTYPDSAEAKKTVEDQLLELCQQMGFDFLMVSSAEGKPLAAVLRDKDRLVPLDTTAVSTPAAGLTALSGGVYRIASVPLDQGSENIGSLAVGERFTLDEFSTPAVLMHQGRFLESNLPGLSSRDMDAAFRSCHGAAECNIRIGGTAYLSLAMPGDFPGGFEIRTLQDIDAASGPLKSVLGKVFLFASVSTILAALLFSLFSAQSIVEPIGAIVAHLRESERTGMLPEFERELSGIREIRELTSSFNNAAAGIREGRENLQRAYVEFVGSLASALDARDRYTAGHSSRVSVLSCATAAELGLKASDIDNIRIGALLHDIGKIGIPDKVLQKPARLTDEEFAMVKQHPAIGRRILEGVNGFTPYLGAVEFHHENWDGTGYPSGQCGAQTPLAARIIHVADAYDAMTTDRPYRPGMTRRRAEAILIENAGTQFDPEVVHAFLRAVARLDSERQSEYAGAA